MITTKTCSTCEHFPNDHHCIGCKWDESKGENTKWELKNNPIVIERKVLDKLRVEIENHCGLIKENHCKYCSYCNSVMGVREILEIIDKYKTERSDKE